jgi:site-specific DNA-methyltransferase (adenine-specific)
VSERRGILLQGDCLELIPGLVRRPADRFDLVYVDPPFNAGGRRAARAGSGARIDGPEAYRDAWGGIAAFLEMLEPRLEVMRDAMSTCSSLWLHLDHRAVHDAKLSCDRVFGRQAYRGEIIWTPGNGARGRSGLSVTHQTILVYSRTAHMIWNAADELLREPYAETSQRMHFKERDLDGRRYRKREIAGKVYRYYADQGRRIGSVWTDCPSMRANTPLVRETTGYPTQKPERLLERILRAASHERSRVLDPMCGSGSTLVVAARLGRRWAGIDASPLAYRIARERLGYSAKKGRRPSISGKRGNPAARPDSADS